MLLEVPDIADWPLRQRLLYWTNRHSDNQLADLLLAAALGGRKTACPETLYAAWLEGLGIPAAGLSMADGSGLSRRNRLTARTLTGLLVALKDARADTFVHSLARPGGRGTLARRGLGLGHRVRAKTGYIRGVFTLAGYLQAETDTFAFAFLANDCPAARDAYRLFTGLLLTTYRWNAADTLPGPKSTGAAAPPR
ncbi:MAG: D-alanyl-D-alanine carboxypeptidase [bacterium]